MLMQQHYKHKTILKATRKLEVTFSLRVNGYLKARIQPLSWISFILSIWCCWEGER